jgi:hypothetical protein
MYCNHRVEMSNIKSDTKINLWTTNEHYLANTRSRFGFADPGPVGLHLMV